MSSAEDHLIELKDGWRLWRCVCLRGTGFPVRLLDVLHAPRTVAVLERLRVTQAACNELRAAALDLCGRSIARTRGEERLPWRRAERKLIRAKVPSAIPGSSESALCFDAYAKTESELECLQDEIVIALEEDRARTSQGLLEVCNNQAFREALVWQNRHVIPSCLDYLIDKGTLLPNNRARRRAETLIAKYLQRYTAKNESIGFFGPIGWASWSEQQSAITVEPGPRLLKRRRVYFEHWAIDALSQVLSRDAVLRSRLAPRLHPNCRLTATGLVLGGSRTIVLDSDTRALVSLCDGDTDAVSIARALVSDSKNSYGLGAQVMSALAQLARQGVVLWEVGIPVGNRPEDALLQALRLVPDARHREQLMTPVLTLQKGRAGVSVNEAIETLESAFVQATGRPATRRPGETYAARTTVYEDCQRDVDVVFGEPLLDKLRAPLSLVLRATAWFVARVAERFEAYVLETFEQMRSDTGEVRFDQLIVYNKKAQPAAFAILSETQDLFDKRWRKVCELPLDNPRLVQLRSQDVEPRVCEHFPARPLPWPIARYHSPDVLIAAESPSAIREGRFELVLGEIHATFNTIAYRVFCAQHPTPAELVRWMDSDLARPQIDRGPHDSHLAFRTTGESLSSNDYEVCFGRVPPWRAADKVLAMRDLVVRKGEAGLVVETAERSKRFDIRETFPMFIAGLCVSSVKLFEQSPHLPRVMLDNLVIARERWCVPCEKLEFAREKTLDSRFVSCFRWANTIGLPRWVFYTLPLEPKPLYVDLESPLSVDIGCSAIRRCQKQDPEMLVTITEMFPTPEQCWLTDAEGNYYSSELRMAALSPEMFQPVD